MGSPNSPETSSSATCRSDSHSGTARHDGSGIGGSSEGTVKNDLEIGTHRRRPLVVNGWRVLGSRSGTAIAMGASEPTVGASAPAYVPSAPAPLIPPTAILCSIICAVRRAATFSPVAKILLFIRTGREDKSPTWYQGRAIFGLPGPGLVLLASSLLIQSSPLHPLSLNNCCDPRQRSVSGLPVSPNTHLPHRVAP